MTAKVIDGKAAAAKLRAQIAERVSALVAEKGVKPGLAVVLVGDDPASAIYVKNKGVAARKAGINSIEHRLPANAAQEDVAAIVRDLNGDPSVHGILVQLPLPPHIDANQIINLIDPEKDVDGLTEANAGRLVLGKDGLFPCTPVGSVMLAKGALGDLTGKHAVVIGRSILVGKPLALLLLAENCTVTMAHSRSRDLPAIAREADILCAAVGRPEMVRGDWVKPGACVIDIGINRIDAPDSERGYRIVGDVAFEEAAGVAGHITPVPGGVGPMTIACLLRNTLLAAEKSVS
ncbi:MAG: bifunctional methylenetetrahydrofolate dehydrogenase/methenyltetrahydrofolate cyclohydrolase FolD [Parvularculaceae bacterium]